MIITWFILSALFIFLSTCIGSIIILFFNKKTITKNMDFCISFAGGIMLAAALFSLLLKALEFEDKDKIVNLYQVIIGLIVGALIIIIFDIFLSINKKKTSFNKLFVAMTLHNIPEGLSVGLSFGIAYFSLGTFSYIVPIILAFGIGIQNIPEGAATSLSVLENTNSKKKSLLLGIISGIVEPIASVFGFLFALYLKNLMPFILSLGAGAMLIVVIEEVIINKSNNNVIVKEIAFLFGFLIMMILDVLLG